MKRFFLPTLALVLGANLLAGCSGGSGSSGTLTRYGSSVPISSGMARSFVAQNVDGSPNVVGFTLSKDAFDSFQVTNQVNAAGKVGASHGGVIDESASFLLPLPEGQNAGVIDHIELDWGPEGHPPANVYTLPHFDVHFYTISQSERDEITPQANNTPEPSAAQIPADYFSGVEVVPRMGVHYIDGTSPEFNGGTFQNTFIYGFFRDDMVFLEPMLTKAWLETKPNVSVAIKQPTQFKRSGWYPTKYNVSYNDLSELYTISLSDFVYRNGTAQDN